MSVLDVSEVFQFAIRIEENGEKLYRAAAEKFDNEDVKKLFTFTILKLVSITEI